MAYCANCGAPLEGAFCSKCGAPAGAAPGSTYTSAGAAGLTDNVVSALCYLLGLVTGILFLVLAPYNANPKVRFHAFQSILLNVACFVLWFVVILVSTTLHAIPLLGTLISVLLSFGVGFGLFLLWLYMMYKAYTDQKVVLPVIGPMAEKQAAS
jgi:uncharacterized membrane protein